MHWSIVLSSFLGTTFPTGALTLLGLYFTRRVNRSLESFKKDIQQDVVKFTKWHEKRLSALETIYAAFCDYLDFLRRMLYVPREGRDLTPMHAFRHILDRQLLYLDDSTAATINRYQGELLLFWNWAVTSLSEKGEVAREAVQHRLDYEIPAYLPRLREDIARAVDPEYRGAWTHPALQVAAAKQDTPTAPDVS
jgi:hypothetical protein